MLLGHALHAQHAHRSLLLSSAMFSARTAEYPADSLLSHWIVTPIRLDLLQSVMHHSCAALQGTSLQGSSYEACFAYCMEMEPGLLVVAVMLRSPHAFWDTLFAQILQASSCNWLRRLATSAPITRASSFPFLKNAKVGCAAHAVHHQAIFPMHALHQEPECVQDPRVAGNHDCITILHVGHTHHSGKKLQQAQELTTLLMLLSLTVFSTFGSSMSTFKNVA